MNTEPAKAIIEELHQINSTLAFLAIMVAIFVVSTALARLWKT